MVELNKKNKKNKGRVISLAGGAVEIYFENDIPPISSILKTGQDSFLEVVEKSGQNLVRAIALTPLEKISRNSEVEFISPSLSIPLSSEITGRMFDVFGNPIDKKKQVRAEVCLPTRREKKLGEAVYQSKIGEEIIETGIKAIDLFTPIKKGGKVGKEAQTEIDRIAADNINSQILT